MLTVLRVAVVDDDKDDASLLKTYLQKYAHTNQLAFDLKCYENGLDFLDHFSNNFDIVFMDIEMPHLNGIGVAHKLREMDPAVVLIFVTNAAQYAVSGYEVNAMDYMVKPIGYYNFTDKLSKAITAKRQEDKAILIHKEDGLIKILVSEIWYIEKEKNYVMLHTKKGDFRERGTLAEYATKLEGQHFSKCSSGCLINLHHVTKVTKDTVWVDSACLSLSRPQRKEFTLKLIEFLGG